MEINAGMVRDLREKTGAGMMDCKKALAENGGDFTKAEEWLRKKGISRAAAKGSRVAAEGAVVVESSADNRAAALVEVNSETDFVARNDTFVELTKTAATAVVKSNPADLNAFGELSVGGKKMKDVVTEAVAKIGEKIEVRRFARFEATGPGVVGSYVHGGKIGVLVELSAANDAAGKHAEALAAAKELALQVASMKPGYTTRAEVTADVIEKQKEEFKFELQNTRKIVIKDGKPLTGILRSQDGEKLLLETGGRIEKVPATQVVEIQVISKPEAMWPNIIAGKLEKFYEGVCLIDQLWVKDDKKKIKDVLAEAAKKAGGELTIKRFVRFEVGEGIEKKKDDLAAEVAKTLGAQA